MSVVQVITKSRGTGGSGTSKGDRRFALHFQVITDDLADGPQVVLSALGLTPFSVYAFGNDFDPGARAKDISCTRNEDDPYHWDVEVDFDSQVEQYPENPLDRPTLVAYSFAQYQRPVWKDINGKGILNSAGRYFDPPPEMDESRLVVTMTRNEPVFDPSIAVAYQDSVNADYWFGFAPGTVKVQSISGTPEQENGLYFYQVVYEFHARWDGWQLSILDQGLYQGDGSKIKDADGDEVVEPWPLDKNGNKIANPTPDNVKFMDYTVYRQTTYAGLDLP